MYIITKLYYIENVTKTRRWIFDEELIKASIETSHAVLVAVLNTKVISFDCHQTLEAGLMGHPVIGFRGDAQSEA